MPRAGDFKTPLKNHALAQSLLSRFFSWDVVDVVFPTCLTKQRFFSSRIMSGSVALDRPLPTPTPANGYKHKKLRSYPKKATETSSEESYPDQMLTPPPQQNGCGSVSETPSPPMVYQIPHSNGGPRVTPSPPIPMDCQLFPPPTMVPHCSIKSELPSPPSLTFEQQHHPFTLYRMEVEKSHGVRHVNPLQLPPSQIPPIEWFSRLGLGMVSPGLSLHGHQIPHLHHLPPALLSMNRYHPYARHHLPHPPSSCVSMGIPPPLPIGQPPVCQLPAGTTLEKVPGDNQLLPQTQQHQQVGAGSISPSLASSSSRSSLDGGGPIRRRKKLEDIPDWVKVRNVEAKSKLFRITSKIAKLP
jgi:hypothetical protein